MGHGEIIPINPINISMLMLKLWNCYMVKFQWWDGDMVQLQEDIQFFKSIYSLLLTLIFPDLIRYGVIYNYESSSLT